VGTRTTATLLGLLLLAAPAFAERLPRTVMPEHYDLGFVVDLARARFEGTETIRVQIGEPTTAIVLNAAEIAFQAVTIGQGANSQTAIVSLDETKQTARLSVARPLMSGPADIRIRYSGTLNDQLRGFYLSRGDNRRYAVTQFEATDARRAFPSFDEPAFKATFAVTLTIDRGDTAISNGHVLSDTPGPGRTQHTMKFSTSPKMSSYLVAMAVGNFQCMTGRADDVPIRICATPDKTHLGRIALDSAREILKFYNSYYSIAYPFGKLDVVAVPDFAAGAMENTAAIFYRETELLADADTASLATRKNIASVLAHEMAHQWFGNLVTMQWWDDLWLNEGFATWMASRPLAAWKPEWNIAVDEALENETALNLDSLQATRPLRANVETPAEIDAAFDPIAYEKGAAVLRMIESYVGAETFRKGVNTYLQAHAYGNATSEDFWNAIASTSGKPVDRIMPTFLTQPGVPLVTASVDCAGARTDVAVGQQRFFLDPKLTNRPSTERWQVPVCVKASGRTAAACDILSQPSQVIAVDTAGCSPWVFANAGAQGYYRTEYSPEMLRVMAARIGTDLTAPERLTLVADEWALVRASRHSAADYLTLASGYARESSSGVLNEVVTALAFVREYLTSDATRGPFEAFVRTLWRPLFNQLGFAAASSDGDDSRALRAVVTTALGTTGNDLEIASKARAALDRALAGGPPLDPALAAGIVQIAAEHGDASLYDSLMAAAARAKSPDEQQLYLFAASWFHHPVIIDRALQRAVTPSMRSQDTALYLARFFANPVARPRAWSFVKAQWTALEPKIAIFNSDVALVGALGAFCDEASRDDVKAFFTTHALPAAARTLEQTIERIDNCIDLKARQAKAVDGWLVPLARN
jgi:aminopeptidase N